MASWTTPVIHSTGDILAVTDWNGVANNETFLYQKPYVAAFDSGGTSISTDIPTQINLASTAFSGYGFSVSSNNVVVPLTGIYAAYWTITISGGSGSGNDELISQLYQNGSSLLGGAIVPSYTGNPASSGSGLVSCTASDEIALYAIQTSGSTLVTIDGASFLHMVYQGSQ